MQKMWKDLRRRLSAPSPKLPSWLHIASNAIPALIKVLDFWLGLKRTTERALAVHRHEEINIGGGLYKERLKDSHDNYRGRRVALGRMVEREQAEEELRSLTRDDLAELRAEYGELPSDREEVIRWLIERRKGNRGNRSPLEVAWYLETKTFPPPEPLRERHPGFEEAWEQIRYRRQLPGTIKKQVGAHLSSRDTQGLILYPGGCAHRKRLET